ncbi:hypothetical protein [Sphingomonas rustica]
MMWKPILFLVAGAVGIAALSLSGPDPHPELLPELAGCYRGPPTLQKPDIRIDSSGEMSFGTVRTPVAIYGDKLGLYFLPISNVVVGRAAGAPEIQKGHPTYLRIAKDRRGFDMFSDDQERVEFRRTSCG